MILLGVDSGYKNTGIAIIDTRDNFIATKIIKSDYFVPDTDIRDKYNRMYYIANQTMHFIQSVREFFSPHREKEIYRQPTIMVAENSVSSFGGKRMAALIETRAVLLANLGRYIARWYNGDVVCVSNKTVKSYFFGKKGVGTEIKKPAKKDMIKLMQSRWDIKPAEDKKKEKTEHEYDAVALCDWCYHSYFCFKKKGN